MSKPVVYETIMALDEAAIKQSFPHGAQKLGERWRPADSPEGAVKTLDELLRDKRKRFEKPRYLRQSYSRENYTNVPAQALGVDKHGHGAPEEAVPADVQKRISTEANLRDETRRASESLSGIMGERDALKAQMEAHLRLARQKGIDIRSDVKVIERRIEALDRKLGLEEAA